MRITAVEATPVVIPLARPFHWRSGVQEGANLVLFTVETDEGVTASRSRRIPLPSPRTRG